MARASRKEEGLRVGKRRGYGKSVSVYSPRAKYGAKIIFAFRIYYREKNTHTCL